MEKRMSPGRGQVRREVSPQVLRVSESKEVLTKGGDTPKGHSHQPEELSAATLGELSNKISNDSLKL